MFGAEFLTHAQTNACKKRLAINIASKTNSTTKNMPSTISKTEKAKQAFAELIKSHNLEGNDLSDFIGFINDTYLGV